jgi:hypothetical protein
MIKGEGNDIGMAKDMGVINQGREETWRENPQNNNKKYENELAQKKKPYK